MIGIDIGSRSLHVSRATGSDITKFPVKVITFKAGWEAELLDFIGSAATIVAEPTGWHYAAPVEKLLHEAGKNFLQITHEGSARLRGVYLRQKTDHNDARALAMAAQMVETGQHLRGVKPFGTLRTLALRLLLNKARRATREATRAKNRIKVYTHAIDPTGEMMADPAMTHPLWPELFDEIDRLPLFAQQKEAAEERAADVLYEDFTLITSRLMTVPYSNTSRIAALMVACDGQIDAMTQDAFVASLGSAPRLAYSGNKNRARPDKKGYRPALDALHLWTLNLVGAKNDNPIKSYFAGGEKNGGKKFNAAKTKLARILWAIAHAPEGCDWPNAKPLIDVASKQKEESA